MQLSFISLMAFIRILHRLGFKLPYDDIKLLVGGLDCYNDMKDRLFYYRVIGNAFRKLFRKEPGQKKEPMTYLESV